MDLRLTFNEDVLNYDKMRPTYVEELYRDVIEFASLSAGKRALEIGIGTGQATLPFLKTGCELVAIELGKNLAEFTREKFSLFRNLFVMNNDFESATLDDGEYDLVYSATAFHWIAPETGYPKVHRLLKSGGTLALFWNHPAPASEADPLHNAIQKVYAKYRPSPIRPTSHTFDRKNCLEIVETIQKYHFQDIRCQLYYQTRTFDAESYLALLNTYSDHRAMPADQQVLFEKEIMDAINEYGGIIDIHDTIDLYLARKP